MHKNIIISIVFTILLSPCVFAQNNVWFIKNDGKFTGSKDSADYIRIISEPDSGDVLYNVAELYPDNKKKLVGKSISATSYIPHGKTLTYYPNGKIQSIIEYQQGGILGDCYEYFPNGKLYTLRRYNNHVQPQAHNSDEIADCYDLMICNDNTGAALAKDCNGIYKVYDTDLKTIIQEGQIINGKKHGEWKGVDTLLKISYVDKYLGGKFISGTSTDSLGAKHNYSTLEATIPNYKGGYDAFAKYLKKNVKYPAESKKNHTQGRVFIQFTVGADGNVISTKILRTPDVYIAAEIERMVLSAKGWIPAFKRGVYYKGGSVATMPVQFGL